MEFIVLFLAGIALTLVGGWGLKSAYDIANWPVSEAEVVSAKIDKLSKKDLYSYFVYYFPSVTYRYEVEGKQYESSMVHPDNKAIWFTEKGDAESLLKKITESSKVRYSPQDPSIASLVDFVPKRRKSHYFALVISGVMLIAIDIVLLVLVR